MTESYTVFDNIVGLRDMTPEEKAQREKDVKEWNDASADRKLSSIKKLRLKRLQDTDYLANSDVTMPDYIKTWRQTLRDLPQNNTSESQYDALLERNEDGSLKNSVWTQPTS
jgi:hypothetical protein|tara:strand:+ start:24 stop:359 length:336 start_codon:yes stop_codon:yes gene_type:complete